MDHDSHVPSEPLDRLSQLPDSLLVNEILSLLATRDAVRTTILSKRWKDLWTTVPCLDFWDESESFIEGAIAKWKGTKILECCMDFWDDYPSSSGILDSWLLLPIQTQVEDLHLSVGRMDVYCPPQRLYSCTSLTKLFLAFCDLKIEQHVQWYQLKTLTIDYPLSLSDDAMNRILYGAPFLEELVLLSLDITQDFNIRSTSLKMLEIGSSDDVSTVVKALLKIWAPNLLSLEFSACVFATCLLHVPSLTTATLCFEDSWWNEHFADDMSEEDIPPLEMFDKMFRSISHVEKLTLSSFCIEFLLRTKEEYDMITFSNTKFLKFSARKAKGMLDVLEMFPQLITVEVELRDKDCKYTVQCEKSEVNVFQSLASPALHQLKTIKISWCVCDASVLPAIEILLQNACMLDKMVIYPHNTHDWCDREFRLKVKEKVLSMPRSSTTAKIIATV